MRRHLTGVMLGLASAAFVASPAFAADKQDSTDKKPECLRASKLWGTEVVNRDNEELGEIENMAIEAGSGKIRYMVLSHGGLMDIGDKQVALPWNSFDVKGTRHYQVFLPVSERELSRAKGIDQSNYPDHPTASVKKKDGGDYSLAGAAEQKRTKESDDKTKQAKWVKLTKILNKKVINREGRHVGSFDDLLIMRKSGQAMVAVVSVEDVRGLDDTLVAIPMSETYVHGDKLRVDIEPKQLVDAPRVKWDQMDKSANEKWMKKVYDHFDAEMPEQDEDEGLLDIFS